VPNWNYVEASNVNVVKEKIQALRAYEINSKAVWTSDRMLEKVAQLKQRTALLTGQILLATMCSSLLSIVASSLCAAGAHLQVTGNNVANANTPVIRAKTCTGASTVTNSKPTGSYSPACSARRHLKTSFGFSPGSIVRRATDTQGS